MAPCDAPASRRMWQPPLLRLPHAPGLAIAPDGGLTRAQSLVRCDVPHAGAHGSRHTARSATLATHTLRPAFGRFVSSAPRRRLKTQCTNSWSTGAMVMENAA